MSCGPCAERTNLISGKQGNLVNQPAGLLLCSRAMDWGPTGRELLKHDRVEPSSIIFQSRDRTIGRPELSKVTRKEHKRTGLLELV